MVNRHKIYKKKSDKNGQMNIFVTKYSYETYEDRMIVRIRRRDESINRTEKKDLSVFIVPMHVINVG